MLRIFYTFFLYILIPLLLIRTFWRTLRVPHHGSRWYQRFGFVPIVDSGQKVIWIHCVSVGETLAAVPLIKKLQERYPDRLLVVTTTTFTGSERVRSIFSNSVYHVYAPYDLPSSLKLFLKRIHPSLVIIMETELWPNLIHYCNNFDIPVIVANARMSKKSLVGYKKFARFTEHMLKQINHVVAQYSDDGQNFLDLGLPELQLVISGNIKFDTSLKNDMIAEASALKTEWSGEGKRKIFLAASTHFGEDKIVLEAYEKIKKFYPNLLLIIVPRHPERFSEVAKLCSNQNYSVVKRSHRSKIKTDDNILLGDTMGELMLFYGACDITFVGGSLVPAGGHSLIEPAIWGTPLISGPSLYNFSNVSRLLKEAGGINICQDSSSMAKIVCEILKDTSESERIGHAAKLVAISNRGALDKLMKVIDLEVVSR